MSSQIYSSHNSKLLRVGVKEFSEHNLCPYLCKSYIENCLVFLIDLLHFEVDKSRRRLVCTANGNDTNFPSCLLHTKSA